MHLVTTDNYIYIQDDSITIHEKALVEAIKFAKHHDIDVLRVAVDNNPTNYSVIIQEDFCENFFQLYDGVSLRTHLMLINEIAKQNGRVTKTDIRAFDFDASKDQSYSIWKTWWVLSRIISNNMHEISDIHLSKFIRTCCIMNAHPFIIEMLKDIGIQHSDISKDRISISNELKWIKNPIYKITLDPLLLVPFDEKILNNNKDQILNLITENIH
jgi:hypothetical protein